MRNCITHRMRSMIKLFFLALEIFSLPLFSVYAQNTNSITTDTVCIIDYESIYEERLLEDIDTFILVDDYKPYHYQTQFDVPPSYLDPYPQLLKQLKYPDEARKNNIEGRVVLTVSIDEYGIVSAVEIFKVVGHMDFGISATEWMKQIKFIPASLNGKYVPCKIILPVYFRLK